MRIKLVLALCLFPAVALGEPNCAPRDAVLAALAGRYGESRQSAGLTAGGQMVETFANAETGSWSITATFPDGRMCLLASGTAFESLAEAPPPAGDPA